MVSYWKGLMDKRKIVNQTLYNNRVVIYFLVVKKIFYDCEIYLEKKSTASILYYLLCRGCPITLGNLFFAERFMSIPSVLCNARDVPWCSSRNTRKTKWHSRTTPVFIVYELVRVKVLVLPIGKWCNVQ